MKKLILPLISLLLPLCASAQVKDSRFTSFVPKGYVLNQVIENLGDFNKDGISDIVLIIKNTLQSGWETDNNGEKFDRNRRGIIVLFGSANGKYKKVAENKNCFASEFEDGGVYYAPELTIKRSANGNLIIGYDHGRYGSFSSTFRYQNGGFKRIGYDQRDCRGPITTHEISINYLTKKKLERSNKLTEEQIVARYGESLDGYKESFNDKWSRINVPSLLDLTKVENFETLNDEQ